MKKQYVTQAYVDRVENKKLKDERMFVTKADNAEYE